MTTPPKRVDRRIQRTRQVLRQASIEILEEKGFLATTVQDITERANVHRGTFYAHFADKYALVDAICRENFQHLAASTLPPVSHWDRNTLHLLILMVLEYTERVQRYRHFSNDVGLLIERAAQEELTKLLERWLKQSKRGAVRWRVPIETIAQIVSTTIFGVALQWRQEQNSMSSEQMANALLLVILEGVAHLAPDVLPT